MKVIEDRKHRWRGSDTKKKADRRINSHGEAMRRCRDRGKSRAERHCHV